MYRPKIKMLFLYFVSSSVVVVVVVSGITKQQWNEKINDYIYFAPFIGRFTTKPTHYL